jgi:protein O-GlcNAcase/histone acetyltransferase
MALPSADFLAGVIEGFYGPPWTQADRFELFGWMQQWGLNAYLYGPKDDLRHRAIWRETYPDADAAKLAEIIAESARRGLNFFYMLGPGLDLRFTSASDRERLQARFSQLLALGCRNFALLFDDIPDRMDPADRERFGSFAAAQCDVTNELFRWVRAQQPAARFLFCPTPYCGRMAERRLGGEGYLEIVGRELLPEIGVCWTGPEIIAREITVPHVRELRQLLRRAPVIWDNLHANDYDGRRIFLGPYAGRPSELRGEVAGLLTNPNTEYPVNYPAFRTFAEFVRHEGAWNPRAAYGQALAEWLPRFATVGQPITAADLSLFGDACYLPYEDGPAAAQLFAALQRLLATEPARWTPELIAAFREPATRLRDFCARTAELRDRALFAALSRRTWELREELDLLLGYVRIKEADPQAPATSDFHLPGTYRGGYVARLQQLLRQRADGVFEPAVSPVRDTGA